MKNKDLFGRDIEPVKSLADKYLLAPTSVLNKRSPKWQKLKRKWINLGIRSELGRIENTDKTRKGANIKDYDYFKGYTYDGVGIDKTVSIFDPVVCEIVYKWFCPDGGAILDPFAGGSVRGIVSNYLGYNYTGIDIRQEQIESNRMQALDILDVNNQPQFYCGDAEHVLNNKWSIEFDLLFSCPPYMNLEVYSDHLNDLSNMNDEKFIIKYRSIINKSCKLLNKSGYAVFVVGDLRDKEGYYKDFTGITKRAFMDCGMKLYNELILIEPVGTKALTMERGFKNGKLAKVHQSLLIFKKPEKQ